MNFIRNSLVGSSFRRPRIAEVRDIGNHARQTNHHVASLETYQRHWQQIEEIIHSNMSNVSLEDKGLVVMSHFEYVISLVCSELERKQDVFDSACLNHLLNYGVISQVLTWCFKRDNSENILIGVVSGIDTLLASAKRTNKDLDLLRHTSIHRPICELLEYYNSTALKDVSPQVETIMVSLSYYVCVLITREPAFLDLFYNLASVTSLPQFPLMYLLVNNLHHRGPQGQSARDSLKLLMTVAKEQQLLAVFTLESDFCPVLAGGLSGVFSDLPRNLPSAVEKEGMFSSSDIVQHKEVEDFVTTLEFCDSILENAPSLVASQLLEFCYNGFLLSVLGPALIQDTTGLNVKLLDSPVHVSTMKEILASTCYLTLCLQRIHNRGFIGIFIRFLLTHSYDGVGIMDVLVSRLSAQTELRLATLQLFNVLVDLNCEDVMMVLTMRHLLPCSHVMLSQRSNALQEKDSNCLWAAKLLSLVPIACNFTLKNCDGERASRDSGSQNSRIRSWSKNSNDSGESRFGPLTFFAEDKREQLELDERKPNGTDCTRLQQYLMDTSLQVRRCVDATVNWRYLYNGQNPNISQSPNVADRQEVKETENRDSENSGSSKEVDNPSKESIEEDFPPQDVVDVYAYCMEQLASCLNEINLASPGQSSGYESFNYQSRPHDFVQEDQTYFSKDVQEDLEFWSMMRDEDDEDDEALIKPIPTLEVKDPEEVDPTTLMPSVGPFLEILVRSVDGWLNNSIEVNLSLCSLLSRLASYPHPLLRSFLLNPYLVLQPSIPSLTVSIATLKQRIDSALNVYETSPTLIDESRSRLYSMLDAPAAIKTPVPANKSITKHSPSLLSVIYKSLSRKASDQVDVRRDSMGNSSVTYNHRGTPKDKFNPPDPIGSHVAICAVLLEEWLHEMAAICMEHAVHFTPMFVPIACPDADHLSRV